MGLSPILIQAFVWGTRMCGLELGVALQGHRTRQRWNWGPERGVGPLRQSGLPFPQTCRGLPSSQGWGQSKRQETGPSLRRPKSGPACPPFPSPSEQSPSPADKPPVPRNQVSLLLHACAAELDQLPLMACRPGPLPGPGRGGGEAKKRTRSGKGSLLPQCRPFHGF